MTLTRTQRVRAAASRLLARGADVVLLRPTVLLWRAERDDLR